jgi:hypothetical protein
VSDPLDRFFEFHRAEEARRAEERRAEIATAEAAKQAIVQADVAALAESRKPNGQFVAGVSPNPAARQKATAARNQSLVRYLEGCAEGGFEFVERLLRFARGEVPGLTPKEQFDANRYLFERVFGKTPERIEIENVTDDLADVPTEVLMGWLKRGGGEGSGGAPSEAVVDAEAAP